MAKSPILGGFSTQRSSNAADNAAINLAVEIVETHDGKVPGFLYGTSGLDLLNSLGPGPGRGALALNDVLYFVSGPEVWSLTANGIPTLLSTPTNQMSDAKTPVSMFQNKRQLLMVDGVGAWLVPGGFPLTGGVIAPATATTNAGGGLYAINDTIVLLAANGVQTAFPEITVTSVTNNPVTALTLPNPGTTYNSTVPGAYTIASGTYNNGSGVVTLTLAATEPNVPGQQIIVSALTGTGAVQGLAGTYTAGAGTAGSTVIYTASAGLGTTAITSGLIMAGGAATTDIQPQPGGGTGLTITVSSVSAGKITAAAVDVGGTTYAVNDTGIIMSGSQDAVYRVTAVTGGVVTGFVLLDPGTAYATVVGATTLASAGDLPVNVGIGLTINITASSGPITASSVAQGGHDYVIGAAGFVSGGTVDATYLVTTVGPFGTVTGFKITQGGAIVDKALSFTQKSTSGSGAGLTLTSPTYGDFVGLIPIVMPFPAPIMGDISDGFGLLVFSNSQNIAQSDELDLSTWQPLNFGVADQSPDNCVGLKVIHDEVFVTKENNTEVWVDGGLPNFAFEPITSVHIEFGCLAPFSLAIADSELIWLSRNEQGQGIVVKANGYNIVPISTQALVAEFQKYSNLGDAIAYARQEGQHVFYVLTFPEANKTWQYDKTSSALAGFPIWTELAAFANGELNRHWGNCFTPFRVSGQPNTTIVSYQAQSVVLTSPVEIETETGLVGMPPSFSAILLSLWTDMPDTAGAGFYFSNQVDDTLGSTNPGIWIKVQNDTKGTPQLEIKAWDASNALIVDGQFDFSVWANWVNVMLSLDTATNQIGVYANTNTGGVLFETPLTASVLNWSSANPIAAPSDHPWHMATV